MRRRLLKVKFLGRHVELQRTQVFSDDDTPSPRVKTSFFGLMLQMLIVHFLRAANVNARRAHVRRH